ncbi:uncharacterized protein LOC143228916 isoform X2 [Tachypleus tridentatus]|uniref:uncharacterized protein LOC143228916 isoform X2 n=1 Tax=Tachypleus tridentatus TaxID=6853 RepID=UPI003FD6268F
MMSIPVVDVQTIGLSETAEPSKESIRHVATQVHQAFSEIGFAYVINHGFPMEQVLAIHQKSLEFFKLPLNVKEKYNRSLPCGLEGYLSSDKEILQPGVSQEMKEMYEVVKTDTAFPVEEEVPGFKQACVDFLDSCRALSRRFLRVLAVALGQEDDIFLKNHSFNTKYNTLTTLRMLHYPPVEGILKPNTVRCGEHSDYGTMTFLFQDNVGGLELKSRTGEWISATPLEDSILVNIGDMMTIWTDGLYKATRHRVLVPKEEAERQRSRSSIAFFVNPDDAVIVEPLNGSKNFPSVKFKDYLNDKFKNTLQY